MKAAAFEHQGAADVQEALRLLAAGGGRAKLIAGGQSLGPMLNLRLSRPQVLVDLSNLAGLTSVEVQGQELVLGARLTHASIEDGRHPALAAHPMRQVAAGIAYRAIRNKGTLGGSLAHADPAADWVLALVAMGAVLRLQSPHGERERPLESFMQAAYTTELAQDELITVVRVPAMAQGRWGYYKFCRKPGEFADASAAVCQVAPGAPWRLALGALDGPPLLLAALAKELGEPGTAPLALSRLREAVAAALPERDPIDHQLHAVCLARALEQAGWPARTA
jgi:aerobic carbon-monoxide dehydrogenase medium subunit